MTERRLSVELVARFSRAAWTTATAYAAIIVLVFVGVSELQMRRSLDRSADVIQSILNLYTTPDAEGAPVAPETLADQLIGMGIKFVITRRVDTTAVYYLSPMMPAQRLQGLSAMTTPDEVQELLLAAIARRARWRYHVYHRAVGEFDIYVIASRVPFLAALGGLTLAALTLLPLAILLARRGARRTVVATLAPLARVTHATQAIGPQDLGRRLETPTGLAEVTQLADGINRMLERIDRAHQALESFTADASHELRTPLTHIRAQAQWGQEPTRTAAEMRESLLAIQHELDRTHKMVEDLLLLARGETRQIQMDRMPFDIADVAREVHEIAVAMVGARPVTVDCRTPGAVRVLGDPTRTRHIILNLVANAVRYTTEGSITLVVTRDGAQGSVEVHDTGIGIHPAHLEKIFGRFYRVDSSRSRAYGGAGLGLAIARILAELQDGRLTVRSDVGTGSTFTLSLPALD